MVKNIKKDIKDEKKKTKERGSHDLYDEPGVGSLGGVAPYAKAQKMSISQGKKLLFHKDFVKGVVGGLKSSVKKHSLLEVPHGIEGHPKRLRTN